MMPIRSTADFMRVNRIIQRNGNCQPQAATGHMPFVGHRTVEQVDRAGRRANRAVQFGFDPETLA